MHKHSTILSGVCGLALAFGPRADAKDKAVKNRSDSDCDRLSDERSEEKND